MRAGRGEPDPPVHGEEAAVGEVDDAGTEGPGQVVGQRVLPVEVAADRGGDPPPGGGADMRRDPQQRPGPVRGDPEHVREHVVPEQLHRGAVQRGDLQPLPQPCDAQLRIAARGVQLEQAAHDLVAEERAGLGERGAGRHARARLEMQAGQAERRGEGRVIARAGEHAAHQDADHGHLPGQRPVVGVPVRRFLQRPRDHALGQEFFQQALALQFL